MRIFMLFILIFSCQKFLICVSKKYVPHRRVACRIEQNFQEQTLKNLEEEQRYELQLEEEQERRICSVHIWLRTCCSQPENPENNEALHFSYEPNRPVIDPYALAEYMALDCLILAEELRGKIRQQRKLDSLGRIKP